MDIKSFIEVKFNNIHIDTSLYRRIIDIEKCQCALHNLIAEVRILKEDYGVYAMYLKALSDETRLKIFDMLSNGELCACDILEEFNITQPTLSYHMKILSESGLVDSRRDGVWMKYSINRKNLEALKQLFDNIGLNMDNTSSHL